MNNDTFSTLNLFKSCLGTHHYTTSTCMKSFLYAIIPVNNTTCWKIRSFYMSYQLINFNVIIIDIRNRAVNYFCKIMRRHIGSHTYRYTRCAINQKARHPSRKYGRFFQRIIKIQLIIHCLLFYIYKHIICYLTHTGFRITHRCRTITIYRPKVTLTVYKHITKAPFLSHTNHCIIYRSITMWVILTKYLPDNTGRFFM